MHACLQVRVELGADTSAPKSPISSPRAKPITATKSKDPEHPTITNDVSNDSSRMIISSSSRPVATDIATAQAQVQARGSLVGVRFPEAFVPEVVATLTSLHELAKRAPSSTQVLMTLQVRACVCSVCFVHLSWLMASDCMLCVCALADNFV